MNNGAHTVIYSKNPDTERAFSADIVKLTGVDVGGGKLGVYQLRHTRP